METRTPQQQTEQLKRQQRWYNRNKEEHNAAGRKRHAELRASVLSVLGGKCECCVETLPEFLCIDHKFGGGNKERKTVSAIGLLIKINRGTVPRDRYRILCHNCNSALGLLGYCPHQAITLTED